MVKFVKGHCIKPKGCNECCKVFVMDIKYLHPDEVWRLRHLDTTRVKVEELEDDEGVFYRIHFHFPCEYLEDGLCSIYEDRPDLCRDYPEELEDFLRDCLSQEDA